MAQGNMGSSTGGNQGGNQAMGGSNPTQIMQMFKGQDFPMSKQEVVQLAEQQGGQEMKRMVESLPDQQFNNATEIANAMGGGSSGQSNQSSQGMSGQGSQKGQGSQDSGGSQGSNSMDGSSSSSGGGRGDEY